MNLKATKKKPELQEVKKIHPEAEAMSRRLGKLDTFINELVKEEGSQNLSAQQVTELLMIKARHNAFIHTNENDPSRILLWLIELVLYNSDAIFAITKQHQLDQNKAENAEKLQKKEKKSPKKK